MASTGKSPPKEPMEDACADWAQAAIAKHYNKMIAHQPGVIADQDPEELHQMRVALRRLRSAIVAFAPVIKLPKYATETRLKQAGQILGTVRDLDVLNLILIETYCPHLPPEETRLLKSHLKQWQRDRQQNFKTVKKLLRSDRWHRTVQAYRKWLDYPQFYPMAHTPLTVVLPDLLLADLSKFLTHGAWWLKVSALKQLTPKQGKLLHSLRKQAKRSRYNLELFKDRYPSHYRPYINKIKAVQTVLGELQDLAVIKEILSQSLGQDPSLVLPTLMAQIDQSSQGQWEQWLHLQRYFLSSSDRATFRIVLCHPLSPSGQIAHGESS